jgi:hypothetical protein
MYMRDLFQILLNFEIQFLGALKFGFMCTMSIMVFWLLLVP